MIVLWYFFIGCNNFDFLILIFDEMIDYSYYSFVFFCDRVGDCCNEIFCWNVYVIYFCLKNWCCYSYGLCIFYVIGCVVVFFCDYCDIYVVFDDYCDDYLIDYCYCDIFVYYCVGEFFFFFNDLDFFLWLFWLLMSLVLLCVVWGFFMFCFLWGW